MACSCASFGKSPAYSLRVGDVHSARTFLIVVLDMVDSTAHGIRSLSPDVFRGVHSLCLHTELACPVPVVSTRIRTVVQSNFTLPLSNLGEQNFVFPYIKLFPRSRSAGSAPKKYGALSSGRHFSSVPGLADSLAFVANHFQVGHANVTSFNRSLILMLFSLTLLG